MKKSSPPPASSSAGRWRLVAVVSVVVNVALAGWLWRGGSSPAPVAAGPVALPPAAPSRELAPYAALGSFVAENNRIPDLGWTEPQIQAFLAGVRSAYEGRGLPLDDAAKKLRDDISQRVQAMMVNERPDPMEDYFRGLREKEGVSRTASGLHYRMTEPGSGAPPQPGDTVVISFAARLPDGQPLPPLSRARSKVAVKDLLPSLAEAVQLLHVGGKCLAYLPPALAFSDADWPAQLPKHTPLVFFVELHEIVGTP